MSIINTLGNTLSGQSGTGNFLGATNGNLSNCINVPWGNPNSVPITLQTVSGTVTANQILALHATPIAIVPAQGANTIILLHYLYTHYVYGTTPYTAAASQRIQCGYGSTTGLTIATFWYANAVLVGTANSNSFSATAQFTSASDASAINQGIYLYNNVATEVTNGDSVIKYFAQFTVLDVTNL